MFALVEIGITFMSQSRTINRNDMTYNQEITPYNLPRLIQFLEYLYNVNPRAEIETKLLDLYFLRDEMENEYQEVLKSNAEEYDKYDYV